MEKRTVFFMVSIALSFFCINYFFDYQNQDSVKKWTEQQVAKKGRQIHQLEEEIASRQLPVTQLPLVALYADEKATTLLTTGVQNNQTVLALSWDKEPPQKIYSRPLNSKAVPTEHHLSYGTDSLDSPLIYQQGLPKKLLIGQLADFGKFELQLVFPGQTTAHAPVSSLEILAADYNDGHFSIPLEQLYRLKKEIATTSAHTTVVDPTSNSTLVDNRTQESSSIERALSGSLPAYKALVLLKTEHTYLPVAIYDIQKHQLDHLEAISDLSSLLVKQEFKTASTSAALTEEKFYVLENEYQQLVFSNYGGALVEINLPFVSEENKKSVVREIEYDRDMLQLHAYNARFPSHPFYTADPTSKDSHQEHVEGKLGGYYPLIRRDLIEKNRKNSFKVPPRFYALNIISEYPEVAELVYEVKKLTKESIVLEAIQHHRRITKTFSIANESVGAPYCINLSIKIEGDSRGLWLTSGIPEVEWISGSPAPALKYRITRHNKADVELLDLPNDAITNTSTYPDWICNSNGFFGLILNPTTKIDTGFRAQLVPGTLVPSRLTEIARDYERFKAQDLPGYMMMLPLNHKGGVMNFTVFAGPFAEAILKTVDQHYTDPVTGYTPKFIDCQTFHGWFSFISEPFANFLFILMKFFHYLTNSWAFSIILLTIALRLMLYPLNAWSMKSMLKMQQAAPEVTAIQEKYKKDPKRSQLEVMNLYREKGINPVSGCLPLIIQMPFLIGMFDLLKSTFELRGASFIPGWIDNLTAPDVLFTWSTPLFFIGNQFHLLPFLLGGVTFLQQRMMSTLPKDPTLWTDQQRQQRAMGSITTIIFTIMFYNFPSGLNLYWLSSMLVGILQQWYTQRSLQAATKKSLKV